MKVLVFFAMMVFTAQISFANMEAGTTYHEVKKDENVWFLAELYYGSSKKYQEILTANNFKMPEDVVAGQDLIIPNPSFTSKDASFKKRYDKIFASKSHKLFSKTKMSKKAAKSELESKGVLSSVVVNKKARLPASNSFSSGGDLEEVSVKKTPAQSAKDELSSY